MSNVDFPSMVKSPHPRVGTTFDFRPASTTVLFSTSLCNKFVLHLHF